MVLDCLDRSQHVFYRDIITRWLVGWLVGVVCCAVLKHDRNRIDLKSYLLFTEETRCLVVGAWKTSMHEA
jgi:hypothetical protein